jgi:hypothetical protein
VATAMAVALVFASVASAGRRASPSLPADGSRTIDDTLTMRHPVSRSGVTVKRGMVEARLTFSSSAILRLAVAGPDGVEISSAEGRTSPLAVRIRTADGPYTFTVEARGLMFRRIPIRLALTHQSFSTDLPPAGGGETPPASSSSSTSSSSSSSSTTQPSSSSSSSSTSVPAGGVVVDVPGSVAGDCSVAVDGALNSWFGSVPDGATVRFAPGGCYGFDGSLLVKDRVGLVFDGRGATFRALTTGTATRSTWIVQGGRGIVLRDMTIRGANPQAGAVPGAHVGTLEWQHGVAVKGVDGMVIDGVQIYDTYGDFVQVAHDPRFYTPPDIPPARNVVVRNSHFERSGRQGVSLIHVDGFWLENSYLGEAAMTMIDLELAWHEGIGRNIHILANTFGRQPHALFANAGKGWSPAIGNIEIRGNRQLGPALTCIPPVHVVSPTWMPAGSWRSGWVIADNHFVAAGYAVRVLRVSDLVMTGNTVDHSNGNCDKAGARLEDSHHITLTDNRFIAAKTTLIADSASTNITNTNNTLN